MDGINWSVVGTEAAKYGVGALGTLVIAGLVWLRNRAKPLYFKAESWRLFEAHTGTGKKDPPFYAAGTIRFLSKRPAVIALHRSALEITNGRWPHREVLLRSFDSRFGDGRVSGAFKMFTIRTYDKMKGIQIPPENWVVFEKVTMATWPASLDITNSTLWFVAETVAGRVLRWRIAAMNELLADHKKAVAEYETNRKLEDARRDAAHAKLKGAKQEPN